MWEHVSAWVLTNTNQQLIIGIAIALVIGLILGHILGSRRVSNVSDRGPRGDQAFFKGVQYILSNDHDHAIEEFTKSVQINSGTVETYIALGNLYRTRGDIDRAIRIRQSIILRTDIDEEIRIRALIDLGLDYRKGGFINRAVETFQKVLEKQPANQEVLMAVEKIYEELKDWEKAFSARKKLASLTKEDSKHILAHHLTEMGKAYQEQGALPKAKTCYKKAISTNADCVDAYLHMGDLFFSRKDYRRAIASWKKVAEVSPQLTFLAYRRLEGAYSQMKNLKPVEEFLKECAASHSDPFTHLALARYLYNAKDYQGALSELKNALDLDPSFWEARKFMGEILLERKMREKALKAYRELIPYLNVPFLEFQCTNCGFRPRDLQWQCPQCRKWDTIGIRGSRSDASDPARPPAPALEETPSDTSREEE
jgi:lipopolysaccharide biosynthesis regulator YciM